MPTSISYVMNYFSLKKTLMGTTALVSAIGALPIYAKAQNLSAGEDFTVNTGVTVTGNPAVTVGNVAASSINNFGTIFSNGSSGIFIDQNNSDITSGITNHTGALISGNTYGIEYNFFAQNTGGIVNAQEATIWGGTSGIRVNAYGNIDGNINNSGQISGGTAGIDVTQWGSVPADIINNSGGVISGGTYGIWYNASAPPLVAAGNIINNAGGTISGGQTGIFIDNATMITSSITNHGIISGYVDGSPAGTSGAIVVQTTGIGGGIINSGTLNGHGNVAIQLNNLSRLTPITFNGGRVIGDVIDNTPTGGFSTINVTGDFTTEGNISVSDLTIAVGQKLTIGTANSVTLNDMSASTGIWSFGVNANTPNAAKLIVTNGNVDLTGATMQAGPISGPLSDGLAIKVADGNAVVTAGPGATPQDIADSSFLWNFQIVDGTYGAIGGDNTELFLLAARNSIGDISENSISPNNAQTGEVLDSSIQSSDTQISSIINNINNASSQDEVNNLISSTQATPDGAVIKTIQTLSTQVRTVTDTRLLAHQNNKNSGNGSSFTGVNNLSLLGQSSAPIELNGHKFWVQGYQSSAKQAYRNNIAGYNARTQGVSLGVDTENLLDDMVIGITAGYAHTDVNSKDRNETKTDINSYQIAVYGDYDLEDDMYVQATAGYVHSENNSTRHNVGGVNGLEAKADYASRYGFLETELGRRYRLEQGTLIPSVNMLYGHHKADDYTETGAGGANLSVQSKGIDIFEIGAEVDAVWKHGFENGRVIEPNIHLGYSYDVLAEEIVVNSRFTGGGSSFVNEGAEPARHKINLGGGITYQHSDVLTLKAGYNFEYKDDYIGHSSLIKVEYKF